MNSASQTPSGSESNWSRRSFLAASAGAAIGAACRNQVQARSTAAEVVRPQRAKNVIFLFLSGGPSHIDTWDPKPRAGVEVRNFDPVCATTIPGLSISENLPRMAQRMHQVALIRSLHHAGPATHAAGQQAVMTGNCFSHNKTVPYFGSVLSMLLESSLEVPTNVVLGGRLQNEYSNEPTAQSNAWLPDEYQPWHDDEYSTNAFSSGCSIALDTETEGWHTRERYGFHDLGRMCLQARRFIERGTRVVTVNQFPSVMDRTSWDMHANGGRLNSTAADYRETLCPQLDQALSGLLDDLRDRGLLSETVVAVCGEMGRSPRINQYGGRDHHTGVWSGLLAGGPIRSGQVVGASDESGELPRSRPVTPAEYCATIYGALGIHARSSLMVGPGMKPIPILDASPIAELL